MMGKLDEDNIDTLTKCIKDPLYKKQHQQYTLNILDLEITQVDFFNTLKYNMINDFHFDVNSSCNPKCRCDQCYQSRKTNEFRSVSFKNLDLIKVKLIDYYKASITFLNTINTSDSLDTRSYYTVENYTKIISKTENFTNEELLEYIYNLMIDEDSGFNILIKTIRNIKCGG